MIILCNGPRKAGTHLLRHYLELMGFDFMWGIVKPDGYDPKNGGKVCSVDDLEISKPTAIVSHLPHRDKRKYQNTPIITIIRDPRNIVVSYMRWGMDERNKDTRISNLLHGLNNNTDRLKKVIDLMNKVGMYDELMSYTTYLFGLDPVVKYEELRDEELNWKPVYNIVSYIENVMDIELDFNIIDLDKNRIGGTRTYNAEPSDWRDYFDDEVMKYFKKKGGSEVMNEWEYE